MPIEIAPFSEKVERRLTNVYLHEITRPLQVAPVLPTDKIVNRAPHVGHVMLFEWNDDIEPAAKIRFRHIRERIHHQRHGHQGIGQSREGKGKTCPVAAIEQRITAHAVALRRSGNAALDQPAAAVRQLPWLAYLGERLRILTMTVAGGHAWVRCDRRLYRRWLNGCR